MHCSSKLGGPQAPLASSGRIERTARGWFKGSGDKEISPGLQGGNVNSALESLNYPYWFFSAGVRRMKKVILLVAALVLILKNVWTNVKQFRLIGRRFTPSKRSVSI